jgi:PAS domain S-box-containing protein
MEDSPSWRAFTGISIEDWLAGSWIKDVHPDDACTASARSSTLLAEGKAFDLEYRVRHRTGEWRHVLERIVPLHGEDGELVSWVGMSSDVTEQKEARLALEEHERLLRKALKAAGMTAWTWNLQSDTLSFSHLDHDVLGVGQQNVSSSALTSRLLPADVYVLNSALRDSLANGATFELTLALQNCGTPCWIKIAGQSEGSGRARGILWDVTSQVLAEERRNLLVGEIAHRGKNLLAVIQAMAGITLNDSRPISLSRTMFLERLAALSRSHSMLTQNDWEGVPIDEIVRGELLSHLDRIELAVPPVLLNPSSAQSIALVVHELATNAAKHGALSVPDGRIRVHAEEVEADGVPALRFLWHEQNGPPVVTPARSGFGSMLLRRLIQGFDTDGTIDYRRDGLLVQVDMPLTMITPHHEALSAGARPDQRVSIR